MSCAKNMKGRWVLLSVFFVLKVICNSCVASLQSSISVSDLFVTVFQILIMSDCSCKEEKAFVASGCAGGNADDIGFATHLNYRCY